jgi:GT2 family glycosyltransferase
MIKNLIDVTIIIITYKSENIIYDFVKKIPSSLKTIIIENSENYDLKKDIEKKFQNISFYIQRNEGVSSSLNFAVAKVETKYFLQISPDIEFNFNDLNKFLEYAKKLNDNFASIGPRFLDVNPKSHKQINKDLEYSKIESIHGSCMFINKKNFNLIGKFDENFFLYFEETEYCYRAQKKGYYSYQINLVKVKTRGRSVEIQSDNQQLDNILVWHFIWSKFYFSKKKYGNLISVIIFTPLLLRICFKILFYKIFINEKIINKYRFRLDGLLKSILGKSSNLRP